MRRLVVILVAGVGAVAAAGCPATSVTRCGDGWCPAGTTCVQDGGGAACLAVDCGGFADGTPCAGDGRRLCVGGDCRVSDCGDGLLDGLNDEACDLGAANSQAPGAACRIDCSAAGCGDGVVDPGEGCDQGAANSSVAADACRLSCEAAGCGDGVVDSGEADGCFGAAQTLSTMFTTKALVAADADGDGLADLLLLGGRPSIAWGDASGALAAPAQVIDEPLTEQGAVADVDGDGLPDLVLAGIDGGRLARGLGGRSFAAPVLATPETLLVGALAAGRGGAVVGVTPNFGGLGSATLLVARVAAGGAVSAAESTDLGDLIPLALVTVDVDGDDLDDVAVYGTRAGTPVVESWRAVAGGGFLELWSVAAPCAGSVLAGGDFTGDGHADVLAVCFDSSLLLAPGGASPPMLAITALPGQSGDATGTGSADLDGDGALDLLLAAGSGAQLHYGGGTAFASGPTQSAGSALADCALLDANHDGTADAATLRDDGLVAISLVGDGPLGGARTVLTPADGVDARALAAADLNGDGAAELVVGGAAGLTLHRGLGALRFAPPLAIAAAPVAGLRLGRVDADDADDAVVLRDDQVTLAVHLGDGAGGLGAAAQTVTLAQPSFSLLAADVDGDGRIDVGTVEGDRLMVRLSLPSGALAAAVAGPAGVGFDASLRDLDGDGRADAVWLSAQGVEWAPSIGDGGFGAARAVVTGPVDRAVVGDFDGDGDADVAAVIAAGPSAELTVLLGDGAGGFAAQPARALAASPARLLVADVNGDGRDDLLFVALTGEATLLLAGAEGAWHEALQLAAVGLLEVTDATGEGRADLLEIVDGGATLRLRVGRAARLP